MEDIMANDHDAEIAELSRVSCEEMAGAYTDEALFDLYGSPPAVPALSSPEGLGNPETLVDQDIPF